MGPNIALDHVLRRRIELFKQITAGRGQKFISLGNERLDLFLPFPNRRRVVDSQCLQSSDDYNSRFKFLTLFATFRCFDGFLDGIKVYFLLRLIAEVSLEKFDIAESQRDLGSVLVQPVYIFQWLSPSVRIVAGWFSNFHNGLRTAENGYERGLFKRA
ncbi:hypothetical protein [Celeribacter halophilus]|uniref:Uncharacterized protein n=1 Tax=Celeribacter halophilus TaxID=576117 RepID=A0A1I3R247_9RHOB|nr:hypothetical protein [Celeribacter halophilus]PZX13166.1 hypothetical protein LX82_01001 [Celeribacter halophilus]SFJ40418.1 hypothetical protein SAMN04488138_104238 [Celeribacter halophilus]